MNTFMKEPGLYIINEAFCVLNRHTGAVSSWCFSLNVGIRLSCPETMNEKFTTVTYVAISNNF